MTDTKPSELEACVLGLLWADGPCTPYAVRRVFQSSLSPQWSGSAGAIYPLFGRLESRGLIRSEPHATGRRVGRRFTISEEGLRTLRGWLEPPLPDLAIGIPMDPLRTRVRFLGALPPRRRAAALAELTQRLERHLAEIEADCAKRKHEGDTFAYAMALGALSMSRARRDWLRQVAAMLEQAPTRRRRARS